MKHLVRYALGVLRHKWHVGRACFRFGLYRRGLTHDMSKFLPSEMLPFARAFYGDWPRPQRDVTGYYDPMNTGNILFDSASVLHRRRNDHHPEFWVPLEDLRNFFDDAAYARSASAMAPDAMVEMLCDWYGASVCQGRGGWSAVLDWYLANEHRVRISRQLRRDVLAFLQMMANEETK